MPFTCATGCDISRIGETNSREVEEDVFDKSKSEFEFWLSERTPELEMRLGLFIETGSDTERALGTILLEDGIAKDGGVIIVGMDSIS